MIILGINAYHGDASACIFANNELVAAAEEERFTRIKHSAGFPYNAIKFCLDSFNLKLSNIDAFVFYEKPFIKFERLIETYLQKVPLGFSSFKLIGIQSKKLFLN